jgi:hypothetical protein
MILLPMSDQHRGRIDPVDGKVYLVDEQTGAMEFLRQGTAEEIEAARVMMWRPQP